MPGTLEVNLTIKRDGKLLAGFPLSRRIQVDEIQQFSTEQASGVGYVSLPQSELTTTQFVLLTPSNPVTVRFAGQTDAGVVVNQGGLLLLIDVAIAAAPSTNNVLVNNASGVAAILDGIAGGT